MSEELKPCPFCGKLPVWSCHNDRDHCLLSCVCTPGHCCTGAWGTRSEAIRTWNTRPIEDTLRAELAVMQDAAQGSMRILDAELAAKDAEIKALDEVVEALNEFVEATFRKVHAEWRESEYSDGSQEATQVYEAALSHWDHIDYKVDTARAKLDALRSGREG